MSSFGFYVLILEWSFLPCGWSQFHDFSDDLYIISGLFPLRTYFIHCFTISGLSTGAFHRGSIVCLLGNGVYLIGYYEQVIFLSARGFQFYLGCHLIMSISLEHTTISIQLADYSTLIFGCTTVLQLKLLTHWLCFLSDYIGLVYISQTAVLARARETRPMTFSRSSHWLSSIR